MSETSTFNKIAADALAFACAEAVQSGRIGSRSKIGDALLEYLEIGQTGGPDDVPTWMDLYRKRATKGTT